MLRKIRILLAAIFFSAITLLLVDFTGMLHAWLGWMAKIQLLPAVLALNVAVIVLLAVLTLVVGRIYCSVICPLGVLQDIFARLSRKRQKRRYTFSAEKRWLRYPVLAAYVAAILAGIGTVVQLLAPYSAYGRIATMLLQPVWKEANNMLASFAEAADSYAFYSVSVWMKSLPVLVVAVATVVLLAVLAWRGGRTYCNTICPVGTTLSLLSRFSLLKVRFDASKCRSCSACSKQCKAACIDYKTHSVDYSRCVVCGNCIESCKFGALTYGLGTDRTSAQKSGTDGNDATTVTDVSRRSFLLATAAATTAAMAQEAKKVDGGFADLADKVVPQRQTPLTPPGALSAENMARRCTGCQLCVSECPNDVLRPSTDLMHMMQPTMDYDRGYCRPECTRCSDVCPTGAIRPLDKVEKTSVQIGHAVWIKKNCLPVSEGVSCGNCARHCPAGAIEMMPADKDDELSPMIPMVNENRCIGCGACEYVCPARPFAAIYVEGHEVHKHI